MDAVLSRLPPDRIQEVMMDQTDIELVKTMVKPLAAKAGLFAGRVMAMITEENLRDIYHAVGEDGIRKAADAIIRIGKGAQT